MTEPSHPLQPLVTDEHGVLRFKRNAIVRYLLDWATLRGFGLNEIAAMPFTDEDQAQLAQLIGYSLSGFGDLSYVSDELYERAGQTYRNLGKPAESSAGTVASRAYW